MTDHVKALQAARDRMVESRREIADELSKASGPVKTTGLLTAFIEVQNAIDQIDKALADELKIVARAPAKESSSHDAYLEIPDED